MAACNDKRFETMLYAYELGMLSDEDREAVEIHQLACEYCFERAKQFREAARLMQVDPAVRQAIRQIAEGDTAAEKTDATDGQVSAVKSKAWSLGGRTILAAAVLLLLLLFRPWNIEISPRKEAVAAENLLAIMYFDNLSDPADSRRIGVIIPSLLITDLSESPFIQVVSSERLYDISKLLGQDERNLDDENSAFKVARKANARWMLTGNILQTAPVDIVTTRLIDVASGNILNTQKITGDSGMTVFTLADSLSARIRHDLAAQTTTATRESNRLVADMTTHSQKAFQYYLEGTDYYRRVYYAEAIRSFEKALEYDSSFAMVYYYLAVIKDYALLAKAVEYSEKATRKERCYIEGLQARRKSNIPLAISIYQRLIDDYPLEKQAYYAMAVMQFGLEKYEDAIGRLNIAITLDPFFGNAYNMLSYSYGRMGNLAKALEMNDRFIFLSPNEPNPYDSRGEILAESKQYDQAIASFKKALEKKSDFYAAWKHLGLVYTYGGDFVRAESCFQVIASVQDIYVWTDGKALLARNLMYQGKYQEALTVLADGAREDKKAHGEAEYATYRQYAAYIYAQRGDSNLAREEIVAAEGIARRFHSDDEILWRRYYAPIMAEAGDFASARRISEELKIALEEAGRQQGDYWYCLGIIAMGEGMLNDAEAYLRKATVETDTFDYSAHYMLGRILVELNRPGDAIGQFDNMVTDQKDHPGNWASWEAEVYYYLGLACQKSGRPREALDYLTKYLEIRRNADSQIKSVIDARERRAALIAGMSS